MKLHRDEARQAMLLSNIQRLLKLPGEHGGCTDVVGLAGLDHVMQRFHRLLDGGFVVPTMDLVEVHVINLKPFQTVVDLAQDRLARQPGAIRPFAHFAMYLGRNDDLIPLREVLQSTAEVLLTRPNGVDIGGIEEIDPQLEGFLDDRPAVFLVEHSFVNPTSRIPEPHATEADARDLHTC